MWLGLANESEQSYLLIRYNGIICPTSPLAVGRSVFPNSLYANSTWIRSAVFLQAHDKLTDRQKTDSLSYRQTTQWIIGRNSPYFMHLMRPKMYLE